MDIPVDEILTELRAVLEKFDNEPTFENFNLIIKEVALIELTCEEALPE